jgi:hypothetical protein
MLAFDVTPPYRAEALAHDLFCELALTLPDGDVQGETLPPPDEQGKSILRRPGGRERTTERWASPDGTIELARVVWRWPTRVPDAQWVAHVAIARQEQRLAVDVRVQVAPGPSASPAIKGLVATCPRPIAQLIRSGCCTRDGFSIRGQLTTITTATEVEELVDRVLLNKKRTFPVVLVSTPTPPQRSLVTAEELAAALCGLADVYLLTSSDLSWVLTERLEKPLSCYAGACRIYLPQLTPSDPGQRHPLFLPERFFSTPDPMGMIVEQVDSEVRRWWAQTILRKHPLVREVERRQQEALRDQAPSVESALPPPKEAVADVPAAPSAPSLPLPPASGPAAEATRAPLQAIPDQLLTLFTDFQRTLESQLAGQAIRLETLARELSNLRRTLEYRREGQATKLDQLEKPLTRPKVKRRSKQEDDLELKHARETLAVLGVPVFDSVETVLAVAAQQFSTQLEIFESAVESARQSQFVRPAEAYRLLKALAEYACCRQNGTLGMSTSDWFKSRGIDYSPHESDTTTTLYGETRTFLSPRGEWVSMPSHLKLGSGSPNYHLRIHFRWDETIKKVQIGHCGKHLPISSSH